MREIFSQVIIFMTMNSRGQYYHIGKIRWAGSGSKLLSVHTVVRSFAVLSRDQAQQYCESVSRHTMQWPGKPKRRNFNRITSPELLPSETDSREVASLVTAVTILYLAVRPYKSLISYSIGFIFFILFKPLDFLGNIGPQQHLSYGRSS